MADDTGGRWPEPWQECSHDELAAAWIAFQTRYDAHAYGGCADADWWAVDAMASLLDEDPHAALQVCFLIARRCERRDVLQMLGASPLEDLLSADPALCGPVEAEAEANPNLRLALRSIWKKTMPEDAWSRIQRMSQA